MENTEGRKCWDFFNKIYCISVRQRQDRRQSARLEFAAAGLLDRVEFILVEKHPENPEQGIYASHLLCMEKGLAAGADTILIFEDDILFSGFQESVLEDACQGLTGYPDWQGLFLGGIVSRIEKSGNRALVLIGYRCLTHAYAVSADFAEQIIRIPWQGIPYDGVLKRESEKAAGRRRFFAVQPMFAFQSDSATDNKTVKIDRLRRILGGLQRLQRLNSWYYLRKREIFISHGIVVLLIFWLVWRYL